jgi:hypothetical protein
MSRFLTSSLAVVAFTTLAPLAARADHPSCCCPQPTCCQAAPSCAAPAPCAVATAPVAPAAPQVAQAQPPAAPQGTYRSYSYEPGVSTPRAAPRMMQRPAASGASGSFDPVQRRQHPSNRLMGP